jgi:hypothetical protein
MSHCPPRDSLERLLANGLAGTDRDELEQHVEFCEACQQVLELLTTAADWEMKQNRGSEPDHPAGYTERLGGYRIEHELGPKQA